MMLLPIFVRLEINNVNELPLTGTCIVKSSCNHAKMSGCQPRLLTSGHISCRCRIDVKWSVLEPLQSSIGGIGRLFGDPKRCRHAGVAV